MEAVAMTRTPIDALFDKASFKCAICKKPAGTCDCWEQCPCGHSFQRGTECPNFIHKLEPIVDELLDGLMAEINHDFSTRKFVKRDMIERVVRRHARDYLLTCYEANEAAKRK